LNEEPAGLNPSGAEPPPSKNPSWERSDWIVLLAYLALAHLVFYPALRPGVLLYGRDTLFHDYGLLFYNWSQIVEHGRLGLWNPDLFCGIPALGTFALCPFYPLSWLFAVLPFALAFTYQYVLDDWLAGLWTYWAARWMGLRRDAAFFGGLIFMVGGHLVTLAHAGHLQKVSAIAWMPLAFAAATAAMKERRWRPWLLCGVALALQLLASHTQIAYYTILFLILWTLCGTGWQPVKHRTSNADQNAPIGNPASALLFGCAGLALALAVAGGLSAAQMLPALETAPLTNRGAGIPFEAVVDTSYPPLEFAEHLLPSFLGDSTQGPKGYWGQWGAERIVTDYMGLLPVLLLLYALAAGRRRDRWFWLAVILSSGVLAAGQFTPVFRVAYDWLPGLRHFRSPATVLVFIAWPAAILAAQGFDEFTDRVVRDPTCRRRYLLILIGAAIALGAVVLVIAAPGIEWPGLGSLGLSLSRRPDSSMAAILASMQRSASFGALACLALAALTASAYFSARGDKITYVMAVGALFVLAFADPRLHESRYIRVLPLRPFQLFLTYHWADSILRTLPQPVRGIETGNELSNRMMTRGIGSLHGYHPVHLQEYLDLLDRYSQSHAQLGRLVFEQFVLTPEGQSPGPDYERRADEDGQVLWLRRPALLYAYFPKKVEVVRDRAALLSPMALPDFDPYVHSYTQDPALQYRANQGSTATARVIRYSADRIDLEVQSEADRPLIVAELAAPGWHWLLDTGQELPSLTANYAFRATRVPAGNHRLALVYRPASFHLGLYLSLATLFVLSAVLLSSRSSRD